MVGKMPCVIIKGKQKCNLFPIPENICSNHIDKSSLVWYTLDTMELRRICGTAASRFGLVGAAAMAVDMNWILEWRNENRIERNRV